MPLRHHSQSEGMVATQGPVNRGMDQENGHRHDMECYSALNEKAAQRIASRTFCEQKKPGTKTLRGATYTWNLKSFIS